MDAHAAEQHDIAVDRQACRTGPSQHRGRVVDSFLFSEPYEADLLALKFELESPLVDEWVATQPD